MGQSANSGHYITYLKSADGSWVRCNDSMTSTVAEHDVREWTRRTAVVAVFVDDSVPHMNLQPVQSQVQDIVSAVVQSKFSPHERWFQLLPSGLYMCRLCNETLSIFSTDGKYSARNVERHIDSQTHQRLFAALGTTPQITSFRTAEATATRQTLLRKSLGSVKTTNTDLARFLYFVLPAFCKHRDQFVPLSAFLTKILANEMCSK
jgi:hypothetical protein